jgi:cholera toxin transcriptional activator
MGMMQIDNAANAPAEPRAAKSMENLTCLTIRTGKPDCVARFYPSLYQLTLIKNGIEEKVDLGFSGSRLLERLVRNPGEVIDRDELMSHAWSGRVVGQGSLNQQIYTLRQILADESEREIIQTLPRRGYLINPNFVDISLEATPVVESPAADPVVVTEAATPMELPVAPATPRAAAKNWRMPVLAGLSALLVLGAVTLYSQTTKISSAAANGKLLTITYAPQDPNELASLIPHGQHIEQQLGATVKTPLHVVVGLHENQLDVVCLRNDGSARTLHIAESQLAQLSTKDLASCLP